MDSYFPDAAYDNATETLRSVLQHLFFINFPDDAIAPINAETMPSYQIQVPNQENGSDCACFMLENFKEFATNPDIFDDHSTSTNQTMWYDGDDLRLNGRKRIAETVQMLIQEHYNE
jgi:hypothetical protein